MTELQIDHDRVCAQWQQYAPKQNTLANNAAMHNTDELR